MIERSIVERIRKNVAELRFCREVLDDDNLTNEQRAIFEKKYEKALDEERRLRSGDFD